MTGFSVDELGWLHLLWVAAGLGGMAAWGVWRRQSDLRRLASARLLRTLGSGAGWGNSLLRCGCLTAVLVLLVLALLGPRWGETPERVFRRNIDVMVLLDVSRSMLARDIAPNRLERAKLALVDDLVPALAGDRVGVIAFAGVPRLVCPLTDDYGYLRLALQDVEPRSVPKGGTCIGDAIRRAADAFPKNLDTHKVILLITDGEDQDCYPIEAASSIWQEHQVPVVAVALGDEREGARIPVSTDQGARYLEHDGQTVWSKANFDELRQVAAASSLNAFVGVGTRNFDLGEIYRTRIAPAMRAREQVEEKTQQAPSRYYWPAGAALALLLIESFFREGPRREAAAATGAADFLQEAA